MKTTQRTSIDNLEMAGSELSEEHLSLASGGARTMWTYRGASATYYDNYCRNDPEWEADGCEL
jgi:hypothetical protein